MFIYRFDVISGNVWNDSCQSSFKPTEKGKQEGMRFTHRDQLSHAEEKEKRISLPRYLNNQVPGLYYLMLDSYDQTWKLNLSFPISVTVKYDKRKITNYFAFLNYRLNVSNILLALKDLVCCSAFVREKRCFVLCDVYDTKIST